MPGSRPRTVSSPSLPAFCREAARVDGPQPMDRRQARSPHPRATAPRLELPGFPEIAQPRALPAPEHVVVDVEFQAPVLVEDQYAAPGDWCRRLVVIFEEGRVLRTLEG